MPELPEVETVKRDLEKLLAPKQRLAKITFHRKDLRYKMPVQKLQSLVGKRVQSLDRRAKYLIFRFEQHSMLSHLGMTGTWRQEPPNFKRKIHDHVELLFEDGLILVFNDPRRFGVLDFFEGQNFAHKSLSLLGPEPLDLSIDIEQIWKKVKLKSSSIKAVLMDQRILVGVGNIYASEALFLAGIKPTRSARRLRWEEFEKLMYHIREVLVEAIRQGGSSIDDFHRTNGQSGQFQDLHKVYGREGLACYECSTSIKAKLIVGRSSFWCPSCQV